MKPAISVLVPVYNVVNTLEACVQSILDQTFDDYEIILVDDGSTDGSGALCDKYAAQYEKIQVIHKANEGLGPTRNLGIRMAKGDYIYHCDSDDWLERDLLLHAYTAITATEADVCIFGYNIFVEKAGKRQPFDTVRITEGFYSNKKDIQKLFVDQYFNSFIVMSACNKMYRREFLLKNDLYFPPLRRCQDMAYSLMVFDKAERLVTVNEAYYCYIVEPGVYKGRSFQEMLETYLTVFNLTSKQFREWGLLQKQTEQKLLNLSCEHIANYCAHAFTVKYRENWKICAEYLMKNKNIVDLFGGYKNSKGSRFMALFILALKMHSKTLLLLVSQLAQRKVQRKNEK